MALHLNTYDFPTPKDALCQVRLKLTLWFFKVRQCIFAISLLSPLQKGSFIKIKLKNAFCQVWLKLALQFLRTRFLKFVNVFSLFRNYLPLGKGVALHLNKLESPLPKDALCHETQDTSLWYYTVQCNNYTDSFALFSQIPAATTCLTAMLEGKCTCYDNNGDRISHQWFI